MTGSPHIIFAGGGAQGQLFPGIAVAAHVANLDPHATRGSWLHLDMGALGLGSDQQFRARDLITEQTWIWRPSSWVRLGPETHPVHIIEVRSI